MNLLDRLFGAVYSRQAYEELAYSLELEQAKNLSLRYELNVLRMRMIHAGGMRSPAPSNDLVKHLQKELVRAQNKISALEAQVKE